MTTVAVVGLGGWGNNLARNYFEIPQCKLRYLCDANASLLRNLQAQLPGPRGVTDFREILRDSEVEAVVLATPAPTHYTLCREALLAGKDVYVEKPFVLDVREAEELIGLAIQEGRILMVGHLLEYHPIINRLKDMINSGEMGEVYYIYNQRVNLGTIRGDENSLWNFAPHDISSILYMLGKEPTDVAARGQCYLQKGIEDVVFLTMNFSDQSMAHVHVSWLDPHKIRKITIVGSKKMAVFDDLEPNEKLRIYDKGAALSTEYNSFAEYITLRFGDITIPHVKMTEPLRLECLHFLECVRERKRPLSDGLDGLRVIKVLDAAQKSLRNNGIPIEIG
ncbi:MAG: Gfo/Idh/MocA family oxidoreductase [Gammaproteobacteria bacterium]|nr:Gfo/Idh/MocA family oxidoreductase [Gammaproteobacteria bacterium]